VLLQVSGSCFEELDFLGWLLFFKDFFAFFFLEPLDISV